MKILLLFLAFFSIFNFTYAQNNQTPFYLWNANSIQSNLNDKFVFSLSQKTHYNLTKIEPELFYFEMVTQYRLNDKFSAGSGYRHFFNKSIESWTNENRFMTLLYYKNTFNSNLLYFTNRISYRQFPASKNHFRYYHKLTILHPFQLFSKTINPYFAEEIFIKINNEKLHMGRIFIGIKLNEKGPVKLDLYLAKGFLKNDIRKWSDYNLSGINFSLTI